MIESWKTGIKARETLKVTGRLTADTNSHLKSWRLMGLTQKL